MLIHGSPRSARAAQNLNAAQDAICCLCLVKPLAEVVQIIWPIVTYYDTQLAEERQERVQERATAQARLKATREGSVQELGRLKRQLAKERKACEGAMQVAKFASASMTATERDLTQLKREKKQMRRKSKS
jgi:hypothetical protein